MMRNQTLSGDEVRSVASIMRNHTPSGNEVSTGREPYTAATRGARS